MFKNCVFKVSVDTKEWFKKAGIRAIKTMAQTVASMLTVGQTFFEVNWANVLAVSATAAVISICTSIVGIPEVGESNEDQ